MKSLRETLTGQKEERGIWDEFSGSVCPSFSWKQRIWGFGICATLGFVCAVLGTFMLVIFLSVVPFAVLYTVGNILALSATGFLVGPLRQLKTMFEPTRLIATIVYLVTLILTLFFAFKGIFILTLICVIIQFLAFLWYALSYIPFARDVVKGCVRGMV
eukprot:TRINITY_DN4204_c0_g1_i1.p1 TRINITY_DN4204_c0_g1~~TRINITY_DN4204_c0_g1_i1.p1  ORF type:complete len:159 (-),score=5.90 TRINITY_DN4204_c0_g1_i1:90-566(-)